MITQKKLQDEMADLVSEIKKQQECGDDKADRVVKRLKKRLSYLKTVLMYIQSNPSKEFCEKERARLENRINLSMQNYVPLDSSRFTKSQCTKHKKEFEAMMGVNETRKYLTTLNFILK